VLARYGGECCINGCNFAALVETAHIIPYREDLSDDVSNGLLLRVDLHRLAIQVRRIPGCSRSVSHGKYAPLVNDTKAAWYLTELTGTPNLNLSHDDLDHSRALVICNTVT